MASRAPSGSFRFYHFHFAPYKVGFFCCWLFGKMGGNWEEGATDGGGGGRGNGPIQSMRVALFPPPRSSGRGTADASCRPAALRDGSRARLLPTEKQRGVAPGRLSK